MAIELNEDILTVMVLSAQLLDTGKTIGNVKLLYGDHFDNFSKLVDKLDEDPDMPNKVDAMTVKILQECLNRIDYSEVEEKVTQGENNDTKEI